MSFILIKTNDLMRADNIEGRIQTEEFATYEDAYSTMKKEITELYKASNPKMAKRYIPHILMHMIFTDVYLGEWEGRLHTGANRYWKIIKTT